MSPCDAASAHVATCSLVERVRARGKDSSRKYETGAAGGALLALACRGIVRGHGKIFDGLDCRASSIVGLSDPSLTWAVFAKVVRTVVWPE